VVSNNTSHTLQPFLIYCAPPTELNSFLTHPPELSGNSQQRHLVAMLKNFKRNLREFCLLSISFIAVGFFNMPYHLTTWERRLNSNPKEVVLQIFIAIKNPSSSARFEPGNLGLMANTLMTRSPRTNKPCTDQTDFDF
jgi:hypothetical protein